jgi:hypothetical protein
VQAEGRWQKLRLGGMDKHLLLMGSKERGEIGKEEKEKKKFREK